MVNANTIKQTMLSELETASSTWVATEDVRLIDASDGIGEPSVVIETFARPVAFNTVGSGPDAYTRDANDNVTDELYYEYNGLRFDVTPQASSETTKDDIVESIRSHFKRYNQWLDSTDFHTDCERITPSEPTPSDTENLRGDTISINVVYKEITERYASQGTTADAMETVNIDADDDGTTDYTVN